MLLAKISNFPASLATNNVHLVQVWTISYCWKSQARALFFLGEKGGREIRAVSIVMIGSEHQLSTTFSEISCT